MCWRVFPQLAPTDVGLETILGSNLLNELAIISVAATIDPIAPGDAHQLHPVRGRIAKMG
jgi:Ca2+/Na+ antiporter